MDALFDRLEFPFFKPRKHRKLTKYAILLNEPKPEKVDEVQEKPCSLAAELLPDLLDFKEKEDMVAILGDILKTQIKAHAQVDNVPHFKPDDIIENNAPTLVPVMYRIATENFAQRNNSRFKIIECRNSTKLISDWKPSLPDKLISLGHQVIVVQLETSYVPLTDFSYAILRQLECEWKNRLPKSFFFPDDVCKVEATPERDLCVVSPSMPDGDLEINKKMGQLNYELLMMIKSSCMNAMKNYLLKRDLRVGKFSDTLDGVSALRQLYRKLQERLQTGETVELGSNSLEDLRCLVKQSIGGTDILAAQTWIEYGKRIGLDIPASASSSATSISSARRIIQGDDVVSQSDSDDDGNENKNATFYGTQVKANEAPLYTSSSRHNDASTGDYSEGNRKAPSSTNFAALHTVHTDSNGGPIDGGDNHRVPLQYDELKANLERPNQKNCRREGHEDDDHYEFTTAISRNKEGRTTDSQMDEQRESDLKIKEFTDFKDSLVKIHKARQDFACADDVRESSEDDDDEFPTHEFSADSILQILQLPNKAL